MLFCPSFGQDGSYAAVKKMNENPLPTTESVEK